MNLIAESGGMNLIAESGGMNLIAESGGMNLIAESGGMNLIAESGGMTLIAAWSEDMRIVAGAWRGRSLIAPSGTETRPTADRVRQALFDILFHASWAGRSIVEGASVLDVFAGTGAMGLEALSRGAARAVFVERARPALTALRANIAACRTEGRCEILAIDALSVPTGERADIVFLDPPYGLDLIPLTLKRLRAMGRIGSDSLIVAEAGRDEPALKVDALAERTHGAARVTIWREG
jgi:16S rRNA (guanine966-N2)-methyltransferase